MNCHCKRSEKAPQAPGLSRRLRALAGCIIPIIPAAALAFAPKCPVCIAAYLSLVTGLGISAAWIQTAQWIFICAGFAVIGLFVAKKVRFTRPGTFAERQKPQSETQ